MKRQARETGSRYVVAALVLWAAAARGGEPEPGGPATRDAVALCHEVDQVPVAERSAVLARGLARAEEAVRATPGMPSPTSPSSATSASAWTWSGMEGGCSRRSATSAAYGARSTSLWRLPRTIRRRWLQRDRCWSSFHGSSAATRRKGSASCGAPSRARSRRYADAPHAGQRRPGRRGAMRLSPTPRPVWVSVERAGSRSEFAHARSVVAGLR